MRIEGAVEVERPAEVVFDYLADVRNEAEWHPAAVIEIDKVSAGPIGEGTVFRGRYRRLGPLETTILAHDRPQSLCLGASGRRMDITAEIDVAEIDDTRAAVRMAGHFAARGPLRVLLPIMAPVLRAQYRRDIRSVKDALEREGQAG